jgi:hypothetical protein
MPRSRVACGSPKGTPGCLESFIPWGPKGDPLGRWCVPCRRRVRMTKELGGKVETILLATDTKEVADLRNALGRALRSLDDSKSKTDELIAAVRQAAADAVRALEIPAIPVPTARLGSKPGEKAAEVAICVMADWQLGKKTPSYSTEICEKRIERYAEKVLSLAAIQRAHHPVKEARVYLLGDLVEGELVFPGQAHRIDASLFRQVITDGPRILAGLLRRLASDFEKVHVVGVIGNHGALGGRDRREYHPETNADAMLYEITRQVVATEKRITWAPNVREGERLWYAVDRVGEKSFLLFHGDQVKGGALGYPWYGFGKKILGWANGGIPEKFDYALSGHFHTPVRGLYGQITHWGAGSTESDNTYAQEFFAASGRPSQWLLFAHPRLGVTSEYEVHV